MTLLEAIQISKDAGDANARAHGRTEWNDDDNQVAIDVLNELTGGQK